MVVCIVAVCSKVLRIKLRVIGMENISRELFPTNNNDDLSCLSDSLLINFERIDYSFIRRRFNPAIIFRLGDRELVAKMGFLSGSFSIFRRLLFIDAS